MLRCRGAASLVYESLDSTDSDFINLDMHIRTQRPRASQICLESVGFVEWLLIRFANADRSVWNFTFKDIGLDGSLCAVRLVVAG